MLTRRQPDKRPSKSFQPSMREQTAIGAGPFRSPCVTRSVGTAFVITMLLAAELLGLPTPAAAVDTCQAQIVPETGLIVVDADNVNGAPRWGTADGQEQSAFRNEGRCVKTSPGGLVGRLKRCTLGKANKPEGITPPDSCRLYIADDGPTNCSAYVRGCVPGVRNAAALLDRIAELETKLAAVSVEDDGATVRFTGVNLQIVSGLGSTSAAVNARGNLIVGYNAATPDVVRTGSHNVVIGDNHTYSSYGGLVAGFENAITGPFASVSGGQDNVATHLCASVSGGVSNEASEQGASVSGGSQNVASGFISSVSGGDQNQATTYLSSITGGRGNSVTGDIGSVSGGFENVASGANSAVAGGFRNKASGETSTVAGGGGNTASGKSATVSGGDTGTASGAGSAVSGGFNRSSTDQLSWTAGSLSQPN